MKPTTSRSDRKNRLRSLLAIVSIVTVAGVGTVMLVMSFAATGNQTTSSNNDPSCGQRVENYNYQVPFGDAAWNVPVCNLKKHPRSDDYADRLWNYSLLRNDGESDESYNLRKSTDNFTVGFGMESASSNWTRAIYYASDANRTIRVQVCTADHCRPSNLDRHHSSFSSIKAALPDYEIPWNDAWNVAEGGDNAVLIIDDTNPNLQSIITLNEVKEGAAAGLQCAINFIDWQAFSFNPDGKRKFCVSSARIMRHPQTREIVDYRTYPGSEGSRGGGINGYATLLTPQEVAAGEIRHALDMTVLNSMFGPECTEEQLAANNPAVVDVTCGTALAPAGKFEWYNVTSTGARLPGLKGSLMEQILTVDKLVPEGMRFALDIDDDHIENWIISRDDLRNNPRKAETARIIARALKDYGWIVLDTNGNAARFQVAGGMSSKNRQLWNELGITSRSDNNILAGLFDQSHIYALEPPINRCVDGTESIYYCNHEGSYYPDVDPQDPDPQPKTGDLNGDGQVNILDLSIFLSNYGKSASDGPGDLNGDGQINVLDLAILLSAYGK